MKRVLILLTILALACSAGIAADAETGTAPKQSLLEALGGTPAGEAGEADPTELKLVEASTAPAGSPDAALTLMIYMCGSNLESGSGSATADLKEIAFSAYDPEKINVVVKAGGAQYWNNDCMEDGSSGTYLMRGREVTPVQLDESPRSMGDPQTLRDFLNDSYALFPAERYALILWDHGGGSLLGICQDELFRGDSLQIDELADALAASPVAGAPLEWIGFDACLMASAEVARLMAPYAHYMIASEESEPGYGWDYSFLNGLERDASGAETGRRIIDSYFDFFGEVDGIDLTLSCVDLTRVEDVVAQTSALSSALAEELDEQSFAEVSRARRSARSFGRDEETADNDFDLVDVGSLAEENDLGDALLPALGESVIYSRANVEDCSGLTLYHPFYNSKLYRQLGEFYSEGVGVSGQYSDYISEFYKLQQAQSTGTTWGSLAANLGAAVRDMRTILSLQLSEEQFAQLGEAELLALGRGEDADSYHLIFGEPATIGSDGTVSGEYVHTNLFVTSAAGEPLWELPLLYTVRDNGSLFVPVQLHRGEEALDARLLCTRDEGSNAVRIDSVWLYDEISGVYSPRSTSPLASFDAISFQQIDRRRSADAQGALLPFSEWEEAETQSFACPMEGDWQLAFVRDYLDVKDIVVGFELTDVFNARHLSELVPVEAVPEQGDGLVVTYDDNNLLFIDTESVRVALSPDGSALTLSLQLMNSSGQEAAIAADNVRVDDAAVAGAFPLTGSGEAGRMLPLEAQALTLELPLDAAAATTGARTIDFELRLRDSAGQELGTVPVTVRTAP